MDSVTRFYFHGTTPDRARQIRRQGFKVGRVELPGDDEPRLFGYGNIGYGTYIAEDWRVAVWFGYSLLKIRLEPGTRLLPMPEVPDARILSYLQREFGKDILKTDRLGKVLPQNKRLTLKEHVAVLGYHYREVGKYFWNPDRGLNKKKSKAKRLHVRAMHGLGADLRRFGVHGYGDPHGFNGLVVFEPSRLVVESEIPIDRKIWLEKVNVADYHESLLRSPSEIGIKPALLNDPGSRKGTDWDACRGRARPCR